MEAEEPNLSGFAAPAKGKKTAVRIEGQMP